MKNLKINPQVFDDLIDIKNYISKESTQEADKVVNTILKDIERLKDFPESGARLANKLLVEVKYRYIITYSYATIYYINTENIIIVSVIHMARDFSGLELVD